MIIKCPECNKKISNTSINLNLGLAQCDDCDVSFSLKTNTSLKENIKDGEHDLVVSDYGNTLSIIYNWRKEMNPLLLGFITFFAVFWNVVTWTVFLGAMNSADDNPAKYFPVLHASLGIGIIYFLIAIYLNKTVIEIDQGKLKIKIKPVLWLGNNELDTASIEQVYVERKVSYSKNGHPTYRFHVKAVVSGAHINLVKSITKYENARKIEELIEGRLGIRDKQVSAEFIK